jgi:hypothetical protein
MQAVQGMQNSGGAQEYSAKEYAEMLDISKRTFKKLISEAKIKESSVVDGVPKYKQADVIKYIVLEEKLPLYINFILYFAGDRGRSLDSILEGFLDDYKFYSNEEYRDRFGKDALEKLRMRIYDILRVRERRGSVVRVVRNKRLVYILPRYATPEQKKEHEDRRNALKIVFYYNPVTNSIRSSIPPKGGLTDDEVKALQMIRAYANAVLYLNETPT